MAVFDLRINTINIRKNHVSLADVVAAAKKGPLVLTDGRRPLVLLQDVEGNDLESIALGINPDFIDMLAESRARQKVERGYSMEEIRKMIEEMPDNDAPVAKSSRTKKAAKR